MKVELLRVTVDADEIAGAAAAICTGSEDTQKALRGALAMGHESVAEHASFTFRVEGVSRVLLAQLTRHRLASFSVQSQRYCRIDSPEFVTPPAIDEAGFADVFRAECAHAFDLYQKYISLGINEEDARYVLPQAICCNLILTMNARELRHFLALRMCNRAQWEIRNLADDMFKLAFAAAPGVLFDAGPGCCTRSGCPEGRFSCGNSREMYVGLLKHSIAYDKQNAK